ncbi:MAG: Asp-tRNA(Asn)/Glu-tRNA(Gln) amidotransferase subunit GatA [Immundisolibacteraceae bacterium]|nr:Asp-tRNA(Asn)/Glu-tRNA(Gln) amidotransferase subunit GatA [Immundisolibacteraceae bacterium]
MIEQSINVLAAGLRRREFSSVELVKHYLKRISALDPQLHSFITVTESNALAAAEQADQRIAQGDESPLLGIPIAHKDIFCTTGVRTSCGSRMLDNFVAPYNATVVEKLDAAGAVSLGKLNMDEFAMGSSNENSYYGPVANPWDPQRVPGGSSGGSAAAVAARLALATTGTDTGGSIRQPAAFCGVTGIKPTYGRVSRYGMVAFSSSLDQGGVFARSAEDAALMLQTMSGFDDRDSTSLNAPAPDLVSGIGESIAGLRIGVIRDHFDQGLDPQVAISVQTALAELEKLGAELVDIELPVSKLAVPAYYVIASAEASSNLARYDGVRYGYRAEDPVDLEDMYKRTRAEGFGTEVKRRILTGTYVLSAGYYDAYYLKAQKVRRLIRDEFVDAFKNIDLLAGPTTPTTAFTAGAHADDPVAMYLSDVYTTAVNLAGLPGISVPAPLADGLPTGLQLIGNFLQEDRLLRCAHQLQQATDWHQQQPTLD